MYLSTSEVYEHVVQMPIAQANHIANHRHDGTGSSKTQGGVPPLLRVHAAQPQLPVKEDSLDASISSFKCLRTN